MLSEQTLPEHDDSFALMDALNPAEWELYEEFVMISEKTTPGFRGRGLNLGNGEKHRSYRFFSGASVRAGYAGYADTVG